MTEDVGKEFKKLKIPVDFVARKNQLNVKASEVHLLHVHLAKGLEFPFVIVVGVADGKYPNMHRMKAAKDEEQKLEEYDKSARSLYVALSRAARGLTMLQDPTRQSQLVSFLNPADWEVHENF